MDKKRQQKQEKFFADIIANDEKNKFCADCGQQGTGWASWNIGVFLCIKCASIHRKMGSHISKVRSTRLDTWTDEQLEWIFQRGNTKMNQYYNPDPNLHPFPSVSGFSLSNRSSHADATIEQFIRDKYERKIFVASVQVKNALTKEQKELLEKASNVNPHSSALGKLAEMGFTNQAECLKILQTKGGNLGETIDYLLKHANPASPALKSNGNLKLEITKKNLFSSIPDEYKDLHEQLKVMGFTDVDKNTSVLKKTGGKLGDSVEMLMDMKRQEKNSEKSNDLKITKPGNSTNSLTATVPLINTDDWDNDEIEFNDFVTSTSSEPVKKKVDQKPLSSKDIMSLFEVFGVDSTKPSIENKPPSTATPTINIRNEEPEEKFSREASSKPITSEDMLEIPKAITKNESENEFKIESAENEDDVFGSFSSAKSSTSNQSQNLNNSTQFTESITPNILTDKMNINDYYSGNNPWTS